METATPQDSRSDDDMHTSTEDGVSDRMVDGGENIHGDEMGFDDKSRD